MTERQRKDPEVGEWISFVVVADVDAATAAAEMDQTPVVSNSVNLSMCCDGQQKKKLAIEGTPVARCNPL